MSARDDILAAVRAGLAQGRADARSVREEAAALLADLHAARPAMPDVGVVQAFTARATSAKVAATSVERIGSALELPRAVKRYLNQNGLRHEIVLQLTPELSALDWGDLELLCAPPDDRCVVVGTALWSIAETGSVVFHSGPQTSVLANFLPLHHIVLMRANRIVPYLEDYAAAAFGDGQRVPRNVNIVTGASGTTDIEGSLVVGAHGPRHLHIVIAGSEAPEGGSASPMLLR